MDHDIQPGDVSTVYFGAAGSDGISKALMKVDAVGGTLIGVGITKMHQAGKDSFAIVESRGSEWRIDISEVHAVYRHGREGDYHIL